MSVPEIVRKYIDAYNRRDVAALLACVADDIVFENISNSSMSMKVEGKAAFAELAERAAIIFTNRRQVISNAVVEGGRVAMEVDWTGIPAVDLGSMKAGEPIAMRGASFMTVSEGLLTRIVDLS